MLACVFIASFLVVSYKESILYQYRRGLRSRKNLILEQRIMECKGVLLMGLVLMAVWVLSLQRCEAFGTFGYEVHHRYSDRVRGYLDFDGELPEKGSSDYFATMARRDHVIRGRHLADATAPVIFADGNETVRINGLGYLYYANVSVGSPNLWFLVALDTGSDLFWLPCDCQSCVGGLVSRSGRRIELNMYSPNTSSTSNVVPCNSSTCGARRGCSASRDACQYEVQYLSNGTSSTGVLVEDVLHMATDDNQQKAVKAPITLGCGIVQTGGFLDGAAPNGLFGLGMDEISVPSTLASKGLAANSFSMCFSQDGIGRIVFGDQGSSDQGETPFNLNQPHPTYNVSITQITLGDNVTTVDFPVIFDSGTSFTYVNDPAYSFIAQNFNSRVKHPRFQSDSDVPFEYCYTLSQNETSIDLPDLNLTMKGGHQFFVTNPTELLALKGGGYVYCLAVLRSGDINIIGQNFMTGYRIVFNRENMVLRWRASDCNEAVQTKNGSTNFPINRPNSTEAPSPSALVPEATAGKTSGAALPPPSPSGSDAPSSGFRSYMVLIFLVSFISHYLIILS